MLNDFSFVPQNLSRLSILIPTLNTDIGHRIHKAICDTIWQMNFAFEKFFTVRIKELDIPKFRRLTFLKILGILQTGIWFCKGGWLLLNICKGFVTFHLTLLALGFFGCCSTGGGGCFPPPSITPLSLKLDYSNFVQYYFGIRWIFCDKENHSDVIFSLLSMKSAKKSLFWNSSRFSIFYSIVLKLGRNIWHT